VDLFGGCLGGVFHHDDNRLVGLTNADSRCRGRGGRVVFVAPGAVAASASRRRRPGEQRTRRTLVRAPSSVFSTGASSKPADERTSAPRGPRFETPSPRPTRPHSVVPLLPEPPCVLPRRTLTHLRQRSTHPNPRPPHNPPYDTKNLRPIANKPFPISPYLFSQTGNTPQLPTFRDFRHETRSPSSTLHLQPRRAATASPHPTSVPRSILRPTNCERCPRGLARALISSSRAFWSMCAPRADAQSSAVLLVYELMSGLLVAIVRDSPVVPAVRRSRAPRYVEAGWAPIDDAWLCALACARPCQ